MDTPHQNVRRGKEDMIGEACKNVLTESDNETYSMLKILALISVAIGMGLEVYVIVAKAQTFDIQNFGIGVGALLAGAGAALRLTPERTGAVS